MTYTLIPLEDFLSNAHSPSESELESFSKHRDKLLHTNENESEEHQKIALIEFLVKSFAYECNTKNRIDLSIYEDNKAKVLFEVKSLNNKAEFINANNGGGGVATLFAPEYSLDSNPCHTKALAKVSKDLESKKDFSLFSKAHTKQSLAHTCKNDKKLESTKTTDSINSTNQTIQNLESIPLELAVGVKAQILENLESNACHIEQSEISNIDSKKDFSPFSKARTKQSLAHTCKNDKKLESKITHPKPCTHPVLVENLESKAFYESILYFLREYKTHNNNDIKHIILTNTRDFYLIDAREYLTFAKDKTILKAFDNCDKNQGTDTSTSKFYATLKDYLPHLNSTLKFTHFNIQTTPLPLLYQALSPQVLLKQKNCIDANTLNQSFYDELLYILGLKEIDQKGKILILPTTEQNTLLDSICNKLGLDRDKDFETIFSLLTTWNNRILFLRLLESMLLSFKHITKPFLDIDTLQNFTDLNTLFFDILALKKEKRKTDLKLKDSIPYLNSSLFDKTELEKQNNEISKLDSNHLAIFKHSILKKDKEYKDTQSLPLLEYLFAFLHAYDFTTTPKDIINHTKTNHDKLINAAVLGLVFEKLNGYKEGSFYTPSFITSYMCKESLEKVVIEKFNERKSWECDSLESLAQKLDKLTDSKDGYKEANAIFDSIKVCDPAVGSGHFLVSMLNAMIELKFRLKILCEIHIDDNGERDYKRLKDIRLRLENDEILIQDSNNTLHTYQTPAHENLESHIIQKALFHNKRILIESCLFGVDINPNSCEITKLRLWIELLKYSFYIFDSNGKNTGDLETLPNIDINIKCGNSLISNIALDMTKESLEKDLKNRLNDNATLESANEILSTINDIQNKLPHTIQDYKNAVSAYKNETNAELKSLHKQKIHTTQSFIIAIFHKTSKAYQNFKNALSSYLQRYGYNGIDNATLQNKSLDSALIKSLNDYTINFNFHKSLDIPKESQGFVEKELITLIESMREYENLINDTNAFEWRFAFPEVLDSNGDFLGFDLVIGNPPYIDYRKIDTQTKSFLNKKSKVYKTNKEGSIFVYFIERTKGLMRSNGYCCFINPIAYICVDSGKGIRDFIDNNLTLLSMIDVSNFKVFNSASTYTCINHFSHKNTNINTINFGRANDENSLDSMEFKKLPQVQIENLSVQLDTIAFRISSIQHIKLSNCCDIFCGLSVTGFRANVSYKHRQDNNPFLESSDIHRYSFNGGKYIDNTQTYYSGDKRKIFEDSEIIFMARMTNFIRCCIASKGYYGGKVNVLHNFKVDKRFLLGILNSKLMSYFYSKKYFASHMQGGAFGFDTISVGNLPIPQITESNKPLCDEIIKCVDKILEIKAKDSTLDTSKLESKLDSLVYKLYNLTNDEIEIIES